MINPQKKRGFVLALTLFVILAISSFSVAMMGIIQKNSQNSVRSHQINTVNQAAEFGLESGRLWLTDQMSRSGTTAITCLLYTSPSPRDATLSRMPSSA